MTVAAAIKNILPKSNASASLLAHVVTSKFEDGLPIFRICRQLERQEMRLSPGTLGKLGQHSGLADGGAADQPDER